MTEQHRARLEKDWAEMTEQERDEFVKALTARLYGAADHPQDDR